MIQARRALLAVGTGLVLLPGVPARGQDVFVSAAVSLQPPLDQIARALDRVHPELDVRFGYGASSALANQIRAGAPVDLFLSADPRIVDDLVAAGHLVTGSRRVIAENALVLMARDGSPLAQLGEGALSSPDLRRLAIPGPAVPLGRYARSWLERRGLLGRVSPRLVLTEHARAAWLAVEQGHVDLAVVYATDAQTARRARPAFAVPRNEAPAIRYTGAQVAGRPAPATSGAERVLRFLGGATARETLANAGFGLPEEPPDERTP